MEVRIANKENFLVCEIELEKPITPEDIESILEKIPSAGPEGIIISGRIPMWLLGAIVHHCHPRPWVAVFDPRLNAGVIVASHTPERGVGDLVPLGDEEEKREGGQQ